MVNGKCLAAFSAAFVLAFASVAYAVGADDHRGASATAMRVALTSSQAGETGHACAALAQSLDSYRKALVQETGDAEPAVSSIYDDSDGMAQVRAKFGCKR